jgi:hypothetical protein
MRAKANFPMRFDSYYILQDGFFNVEAKVIYLNVYGTIVLIIRLSMIPFAILIAVILFKYTSVTSEHIVWVEAAVVLPSVLIAEWRIKR